MICDIEINTLTLHPNPATNLVNISFAGMRQVQVLDISGRMVFSSRVSGTKSLELDVTTFGKGVFLVKVIAQDGSMQSRKLVIQ
jgi:hypothetical protein